MTDLDRAEGRGHQPGSTADPADSRATDRADGLVSGIAVGRLTELQTLATRALDCWRAGDYPGASAAAEGAMTAAGAAIAALRILTETGRADPL
ncbi:hypothetical protein ABT095_31390 [Kitasatospora sp. NPDC002227]|uniref:hypothetical protein n=1 Tax=Kitasatospora sp. NPDC002227 TaxID=3154773 RepID=UPI00332E7385